MKKNNTTLAEVISYLEDIIEARSTSIEDTYTSSLLKKSIARISQKVGEEAVEVVIAANLKDKKQIISESADLLFHLMVLWKKLGVKEKDVAKELFRRKK
ncbi:phosphoribosyl-ATP diphosphatase [Alphaproteobacteria bacterium]|nr:phosphoribosyl-ATP diphosphatase [Alphaproteobacteria bacterium]